MASPIRAAAAAPRHARAHPWQSAVALYAVLVALNTWKRGQLPTTHELVIDAGLAGLVIVSASVFPDAVTWLLVVVVLYWLLANEPAMADAIGRFVKQIGA